MPGSGIKLPLPLPGSPKRSLRSFGVDSGKGRVRGKGRLLRIDDTINSWGLCRQAIVVSPFQGFVVHLLLKRVSVMLCNTANLYKIMPFLSKSHAHDLLNYPFLTRAGSQEINPCRSGISFAIQAIPFIPGFTFW